MTEQPIVYGIELLPERQMYQIVLVETMTKSCLVMPSAQMTAESIADAMNTAHYSALGQSWTRPIYPILRRDTKLGPFVDKEN